MFYICKLAVISAFLTFFFGKSSAQNHYSDNLFAPSLSQTKYETRAVWLTTISGLDWPRTKANDAWGIERQKAELIAILDRYQRININTVILQTRIRGTVIYPSRLEPWDECLTGHPGKNPGYDPLQFCIEECHRRGMELHAWVVSVPLGKSAKQKQYGAASIVKRQPSLCRTVGQEVFMIPGNPATASYIADLCREIADNYDVDGISLDYIRYPEKEYGFNDADWYGGNQTTVSTPAKSKGKKTAKKRTKVVAKTAPAEWKRENITRIVRCVHDAIKPTKPWVKLSSSPIGKYRDLSRYSSRGWNCYDAVWQDPQLWLRENLQDLLFPMMYFQGDHFYPFVYNWQECSYGHPVVPGLGIYFLDPREGKWEINTVRAEMHTTRNCNVGGVAFYRSDFLTRNCKGIYDVCQREFFSHPALPQPMTWMGNTSAPSAPSGVEYSNGELHWNESGAYYYNVYGSNELPVDCSRADNLIAIHVRGNACKVNAPKMYYAVTASDRLGNESEPAQSHQPETKKKARTPYVPYLINRSLRKRPLRTPETDRYVLTSAN